GDGRVDAGATIKVALDADPAKVTWELHRDWFQYDTGGDSMPEAPQFPDAIVKASDTGAELKMPAEGGGYPLYAYLRGADGAAVANLPLFVNGQSPKPQAHKAALPLVIFQSGSSGMPYIPSGWMGNYNDIGYSGDCTINPHAGKTCLKLEYRAAGDWGGIV